MTKQTQRKLAKAQALMKQGMSVKDACRKARLPYGTYYHALKGAPKRRKPPKPTMQTIAVAPPRGESKLVCLVGSTDDILAALKGMKE